MTQRSFNLTLSRWHHVADRIRQVADSRASEALMALNGTSVGATLTQDQVEALRARGAKALESLALARTAQTTVALIRRALAQANAQAGVTGLLADAEGKRREAKLLRQFAGLDLVTKTGLDQANDALAAAQARERTFGRTDIAVTLVAPNALDGLANEAAALESAVAALTDQVADLNRTKLELSLPEELAQIVGL